MRKLSFILVLTALVISGLAGDLSARNSKNLTALQEPLLPYSFPDRAGEIQTTSLGSATSDGGSPGYLLHHSWKDDQNHLNPGRMIDWGGGNPQLHFIVNLQACAGFSNPNSCARWVHYNMFDPTTSPGGVFINGPSGIPLNTNPFSVAGLYPNMAVDENGRIIAVAEGLIPSTGLRWSKLWWDADLSSWGTFISDSIPDQNVGTGIAENRHYPIIEYQEYAGQYVTHVVALNGLDPTDDADKQVAYWRKVNTSSGIGGSWTVTQIADGPWSDTYDMSVSRDGTGKAAIAWCEEQIPDGTNAFSAIWVIRSNDAGATWTARENIVPYEVGVPSWQAWNECNLLFDSDNYLHIVYNAKEYDGVVVSDIDPARIIHWTDRIAGPLAGGSNSVVQNFDWDGLATMCGRFGHNLLIVGMPSISECNGRLYTIWMQAGDPDRGDSLDCVAETPGPVFLGAYNSDINMSVSVSLDGMLWDSRRNLTNSKAPDCDGTDGNPCDHDAWPTMSRYGMDTRESVIGPTYWSAVPEAFEVRDALDASYPDSGFFLDVQFMDDLLPESAMFLGSGFWTNNPIKWFRLPCISPVIRPDPYLPVKAYLHPQDWVKSGTEVELEIEIINLGNSDLNITSITSSILQGSGWLLYTPSLLVLPGETGIVSVVLNQGGAITTPPGSPMGIEAWLMFENDNAELGIDSFYINSVIADTVIQVAYDIVTTGIGMQLGVLNNGSAANYPNSGGYLAFENDSTDLHDDCDSQEVYLYEVTPIIMYDATTYFWNGYYDIENHDPAVNLLPVDGAIETEQCTSGDRDQYITGYFVTADSAIGMNKVWVAPTGPGSAVLEKWQIFSYDGLTHTGVQLGEWADCDVPSDSNVNNTGTIVQADDYVYVTGQETDSDQPCVLNDSRFYVHGLLGYYWQSEYDLDGGVNHTGLAGAYVTQATDLMDVGYSFIPDSVWSYLTKNEFTANNSSWDDQRTLLSFGSFDILPGDTLVIWTMHGSLIHSDASGVADLVADAKAWYDAIRDQAGECSCCGMYTGGFPGNINCDEEGKRNLADITKLIDCIYISSLPDIECLCCRASANVNADVEDKINLADITKLIDHVYISKAEVPPCL